MENKKEVSRQRRWQLKMKEEGRCMICGKRPLADNHYCEEHRIKQIMKNRKQQGTPLDAPIRKNGKRLSKFNPNYKENIKEYHRNHSRNRYRIKHGIPLDKPINKYTKKEVRNNDDGKDKE